MKKYFILFILFSLFSLPLFARESIYSSIFDRRMIPIKVQLTAPEDFSEVRLRFLPEFPCQKQNDFWGSGSRVSEGRKAMMQLQCLYAPETLLFTFEERYTDKKPLLKGADIHGVYRCALQPTEKRPDTYFTINVAECDEETLPDTFLNSR